MEKFLFCSSSLVLFWNITMLHFAIRFCILSQDVRLLIEIRVAFHVGAITFERKLSKSWSFSLRVCDNKLYWA